MNGKMIEVDEDTMNLVQKLVATTGMQEKSIIHEALASFSPEVYHTVRCGETKVA